MKYVDADIFAYSAIYADAKASAAKKILMEIASGKLAAATASLAWDELVWAVGRIAGRETATEEGRNLIAFPNLRLLPVDSQVISRAQKLIEIYELGPRDAIHAACALENELHEIISDDRHFDKLREIKRIPLT